MLITYLEAAVYLVLGVLGVTNKWEELSLTALAGLILLLVFCFLVDTKPKFAVSVLAAGQMACGIATLVRMPPVLLQSYLPMVLVHMLLSVCSLFLHDELREPEKPRITNK